MSDARRRLWAIQALEGPINNAEINFHSSIMTAPCAIRFPTRHVGDQEVEHGILLNASLIQVYPPTTPSIRNGHVHYSFFPSDSENLGEPEPYRSEALDELNMVSSQIIATTYNISEAQNPDRLHAPLVFSITTEASVDELSIAPHNTQPILHHPEILSPVSSPASEEPVRKTEASAQVLSEVFTLPHLICVDSTRTPCSPWTARGLSMDCARTGVWWMSRLTDHFRPR
jgi:hypothetical protein